VEGIIVLQFNPATLGKTVAVVGEFGRRNPGIFSRSSQLKLVPPAPKVLKAIRADIKKRKFTPRDRRMSSGTSALVAEPMGKPGFNEGIFYPEHDLPRAAGGVACLERRRSVSGLEQMKIPVIAKKRRKHGMAVV